MKAAPLLPPFYRLLGFAELDSTNEEAKRQATAGAPEGALVWARAQSAGRGRRGRRWVSEPGNLYLSILLRPSFPPATAAQLGFAAALAVGEAAAAALPAGADVAYKWPNDVLISGRKASGILLESQAAGEGRLDWLVVGIGGLLFRTVHLFFIRDVETGLVWMTKILTDPFNDFKLYHKAPLALLRGELIDPGLDIIEHNELTEQHA